MISKFFIDRPIFAIVISLIISIFGLLSMATLPVAKYPQVTPPQVRVSAAYIGANAEVVGTTVASVIERQLVVWGVDAQISSRRKHLYSIYKKLVAQRIPLERVYDKVAFRIIVRTVKECYQALGTVHADWTPVPGRIKDFISAPKANNYQSLHTIGYQRLHGGGTGSGIAHYHLYPRPTRYATQRRESCLQFAYHGRNNRISAS